MSPSKYTTVSHGIHGCVSNLRYYIILALADAQSDVYVSDEELKGGRRRGGGRGMKREEKEERGGMRRQQEEGRRNG